MEEIQPILDMVESLLTSLTNTASDADPTLYVISAIVATLGGFAKWYFSPPKKQRTCSKCKHFDHSKGQAAMRDFPNFIAAASIVPPTRMGAAIDEEGNPIDSVNVPSACKWDEFGACGIDHEVVVWKGDTCSKWSRRIGSW